MGRAIVREPTVFLMDEPLSNLDAKLRVQMRAEVPPIQRRVGTTTVNVTHDQIEAMTMGHRVAVMRDRGPPAAGRAADPVRPPRQPSVAAFIGSPSMNLYEASLTEGCPVGPDRFAGGPPIPAAPCGPRTPALAAYGGKAVVIGIRPENLPAVPNGNAPRA